MQNRNDRLFTLKVGPGEFDSIPCRYDLEKRKLTFDDIDTDKRTGERSFQEIVVNQSSIDPLHQQIWGMAMPHIERYHALEGQTFEGESIAAPIDPTAGVAVDEEDDDMDDGFDAQPETNGVPGFPVQTHKQLGHIPQPIPTKVPQTAQQPVQDVGNIVLINTQHQTLNMLMGFLQKHLDKDDGDWNIIDIMWQHNLQVYHNVTGEPIHTTEEKSSD